MWPECNTPVMFDSNAGWAAGASPDPLSQDWLQSTPNLLRTSLLKLHQRWPTDKMVRTHPDHCTKLTRTLFQYISEFGFVEPFESERQQIFQITEDINRYSEHHSLPLSSPISYWFVSDYYMTYLGEIVLSIHEDKVPVAGTFSWGTF